VEALTEAKERAARAREMRQVLKEGMFIDEVSRRGLTVGGMRESRESVEEEVEVVK